MQVKEMLMPYGQLKAFNLVMDRGTGNSKVGGWAAEGRLRGLLLLAAAAACLMLLLLPPSLEPAPSTCSQPASRSS
jgi:hypothetical protein